MAACISLVEALFAEVVLLFEVVALVETLLVLDVPTKVSSLEKLHPSVDTASYILLAETILVVVVLHGKAPVASLPQTSPVSLI